MYSGIFTRGKSRLPCPGTTFPLSNICTEFSSGMYSPEVFTIAQLLGELPHSVLSAIAFWMIMVSRVQEPPPRLILTNSEPQIYAQGFGQGSAGLSGTGLQLVAIIFVELFGVSLGQLVAAITPSVQVGILFDPFLMVILTTFCSYFQPLRSTSCGISPFYQAV